MSDDQTPEQEEEEFLGYRLTLTVAGPSYQDVIELEDLDCFTLQPSFVDVNGLIYERYQGETEQEYIEVRFDYVVSRRLELIRKPPAPAPAFEGMPEEEPMIVLRPPELRGGDTR